MNSKLHENFEKINFISVKEFRKLGGLQEINRQVLHPAGMAIEVIVDQSTGEEKFGGIWDYRNDPEGILYGNGDVDQTLVKNIKDLQVQHDKARIKLIGHRIQKK